MAVTIIRLIDGTNGRVIKFIGDSVNNAAMLAGKDYRARFVITPQVFRKLKPETRKKFHKFTPPVVYIAE